MGTVLEAFHTVAVIGSGRLGHSFALRCVRAGFQVVLEDVLRSKLHRVAEVFSGEPLAVRERVRLAESVEDAVRGADVAVDFVPDELESKLEIWSMMDRMAPPRTIFCTPTALSLADLASCTYRATQCVALVPTGDEFGAEVRMVRSGATADDTVRRVAAWLERLGFRVAVEFDPACASVGQTL